MPTKSEKDSELQKIWDDIDNKLIPRTFEIADNLTYAGKLGDLKNVQKRLANLIEVYGPKAEKVRES